MRSGQIFGVVGAVAGFGLGTFMAGSSVLQGLKSGAMSGSDAGLSFAVIGAILGFSCASVGIIYNKFGTHI